MSEMIERVEDAIMEAMNADPKGGSFSRAARAAIEAMREPTKVMLNAVRPQGYTIEHYHGTGHHRTFPTLGSGPLQVWQDMIDAALSEVEG